MKIGKITPFIIAFVLSICLFTIMHAEDLGKHPTPRPDGVLCQGIDLAGMENITTTVGTTEYSDYSITSTIAFNEPALYTLFDADGKPSTIVTFFVGATAVMTHEIATGNKEWSPIYPAPRNATSIHIEVPTGKGRSTSFCLLSGNRKGTTTVATAIEETQETHLNVLYLPNISK